MRAPEFWARPGIMPALLAPLGALYGAVGAMRRRAVKPWHAPVPVICVGNLVAGGAGKTPVVLSLARLLAVPGKAAVHVVTRGYGGRLAGPLMVDPARHGADDVGDEPLLLAAAAVPTWVARDRVAGARAAVAAGAKILLLDDGFQNPSLAKDLSLLVVDGGYGFGNGLVMPAGPLREPVGAGLARAQAMVLIGEDEAGVARTIDGGQGRVTLLRADLVPAADAAADLAGRRVLAFAGIGRPAKFFATLQRLGAEIAETRAFPDHHPYAASEIETMLAASRSLGAVPVTTAKDAVRLPPGLRDAVRVLPVELVWREPDAVASLLDRFVLSPRRHDD